MNSKQKSISVLGVLGGVAVFITIFGFVTGDFSLPQLFAARSSSPAAPSGQVHSGTATPVPTAAPIPTATPLPRPGTVLYRANWSSGSNGWSGTVWGTVSGMLVCNGQAYGSEGAISAPFSLPVADYAVESSIQLIKSNVNGGGGHFGLVARANGENGYMGAIDADAPLTALTKDFGFDPFWSGPDPQDPYTIAGFQGGADTAWHTYRLVVKGNTLSFFIDGNKVLSATDNTYLHAGYAGLWCSNDQIQVRSFQIISE